MRTTDPDPEPLPPLGEKVAKPAPAPRPEWTPVPDAPHIERDAEGRLRTNLPLPK